MEEKEILRKVGNMFIKILLAATIALISSFPAAYAATSYSTSLDPSTQFQTVEGWGTSLAWWAHVVGGYSNKTEYADKIFGSDGLNLNVARYNIGGGENPSYLPPNKTYLSYRARVPGFESANGTWDWTADANQRWMLLAAQARGANQFEAFSNSPPYWMTNSGSVTGSSTGATDNLNSAYYDSFADYLTTVVQHYKDYWGITFKTLEPLNEPISTWWKFGGSQEGAHFDRSTQNTILGKVAASLSSKGLSTRVSASDENSIDNALTSYNSLSSSTKNSVYQINTHSYNGSKRVQLANAAQSEGKQLWMSEYGDNDASGLTMSKTILKDMKQLHASAWVYWQAVDNAGGWGLLKNPLDGSGNTSYTINQKYYVMGNYSKFIRPGYKIIAVNDANSLAAYDPTSSTVVIVTTNSGTTDTTVTYDLSKFNMITGSATPYRTSSTEQLAQLPSIFLTNNTFSAISKAGSVTTYVISGATYFESLAFDPSTYYLLTNQNSGLLADVNGASPNQGANLIQWFANPGNNQQWLIQGLGDGTYYLVNQNSGMAMDVSGASKTAGANVIQWPYNDGNNQKWTITGIGSGYYKLVNVNSGMLLDVKGASSAAAASLTQSPDNNGSSQHWRIQPITPVTTSALSPVSPDGKMNWYVSPVTLTLTTADSVKSVASTVYSLDNGTTWNTYTRPISFNQDGQYSVRYYSTDVGGRVEYPKTSMFKLDQIPPITVDDAPTGWVNKDVTVTLHAQDAGSVVASTYFIVDGGQQQTGTSISLTNEGMHTITYWSVDQAGNTETQHSVQVNIDKTAPTTIAIQGPAAPDGQNGWYLHPVTVSLNAADNRSGVTNTVYSLDNGTTWQTYTSPISLSQDGKYNLEYYSVDNAGNAEQIQALAPIHLDMTPPTINIQGPRGNSYPDDETAAVNYSVADTLSGVNDSSVVATLDGQPTANGTVIALYKLSFGQHVLAVSATDHAGNFATETVSFNTATSISSLERLVNLFQANGSIDNRGIANSLLQKLQNNDLKSFINEVNAQSGKHISSEVAFYLLRDAKYLLM